MAGLLRATILAHDAARRERSLDGLCAELDRVGLLAEIDDLEALRRTHENLYERVRATVFLAALYRYHLPRCAQIPARGSIPERAHAQLLERDFEAAIDGFLEASARRGLDQTLASALACCYHQLAFQTLADQVKHSVRGHPGNRWMFALSAAADHPLRLREELLDGVTLRERTPVRLDLTHSGWSDIFFLGMDDPEGAKVLNISVALGVRGRDARPEPPIETTLRVIDRPVLRLESIDLHARAELTDTTEVFDFGRDHLGLLKAGVVASGLVAPGLEDHPADLAAMLAVVVGRGRGLELTSHVRGIPRGSRLAVSTNLLASLIALLMRATRQTRTWLGALAEEERRLVAARAILGEWLGGSGGGWQDSGGLWPGAKLIEGARAEPGDPEYGASRGRLLPCHRLIGEDEFPHAARRALCRGLVLVHGGMAQDVGPVLEQVTEKYLLRGEREQASRAQLLASLGEIRAALKSGDLARLGAATTANFAGPLPAIVPRATNFYTELLIERTRARFGERFHGFCMHGGMAGGGMGFLFDPAHGDEARVGMAEILSQTKRDLERALPFAMEPVVYDFAIDDLGSRAERDSPYPRPEPRPPARARSADGEADGAELEHLLAQNGFDPQLHARLGADLRAGRIGLARNRLPAETRIESPRAGDVSDASRTASAACLRRGRGALAEGSVAVVTLAGGSGSRWTGGARAVKALNPFAKLDGDFRSFLDVHLAKSRRTAREVGVGVQHVVTTSFLTHGPIADALAARPDPWVLARASPGHAIGLRRIPMVRDLRYLWEQTARQELDERAQKLRLSVQAALIEWALGCGEGSDYRDNAPVQCLHAPGHAYEVANLLANGTLRALLAERPGLRTLLLHNIDTLGAHLDPGLLGRHLESEAAFTFELTPRRIEDSGGGLARVNGELRLIEALALPRDEDELRLADFNTMTTWIDVDGLLELCGLARADLDQTQRVAAAARRLTERLPTYVTLKDVVKRWGHGHEDVYPVAQFERLWSDVTTLSAARVAFLSVPRPRGQQLKDVAHLDPWLRDGSAAFVAGLCDWGGGHSSAPTAPLE